MTCMAGIATGIPPVTGDSAAVGVYGEFLECVSVRSGAYLLGIGDSFVKMDF